MGIKIPFTNIQWSFATIGRRLLDKGLLHKGDLKPRLMAGLDKEAEKYATKMAKKGRDITAADIEKKMTKDSEFVKLCNSVGIGKSDLGNIAYVAFKRYKKARGQ